MKKNNKKFFWLIYVDYKFINPIQISSCVQENNKIDSFTYMHCFKSVTKACQFIRTIDNFPIVIDNQISFDF